jgi:uncharacterized damage-inducible protein DinB
MAARSLFEDAFAHHVWATIALIDACEALSPEQARHMVPGTRGPIVETLAHIVDADAWDLAVIEGANLADIRDAGLDLGALRAAMERNGARWLSFLSGSPDPDAMVTEVDPEDGFRRIASVGMRLAGSLEHGTDHRSQICTALTTLGIEPPRIDVMVFGVETGRVEETGAP